MRRVVVVVVAGLTGCFDAGVDANATIACESQSDCPENFRCVDALGRCVALNDSNDETPPTVVDVTGPAPLGRGASGVIEFSVDEDLAAAPGVFGNGVAADVVEDGARAFHVNVDGDSYGEGFVGFEAVLVDVAGNLARVPLAVVRVDRTPPVLVALDAPKRVREGRFVVTAFASEDLGAVDIAITGTDVSLNPSTSSVVDGAIASFEMVVDVQPPLDGDDGDFTVTLQTLLLSDVVQNAVEVEVATAADLDHTVVIDRTPPAIDIAVVTPRVSFRPGFNTIAVDVDVDAGDGDAATVIATFDRQSLDCTSTPGRCIFSLAGFTGFGVQPGAHALTVAAFDSVGNASFDGAEIIVDDAAPTIDARVHTEASGRVVPGGNVALGGFVVVDVDLADEGSATFTASLVDGDGVAHEFDADGRVFVDAAVAGGAADVSVVAIDDVGNRATVTLDDVVTIGPSVDSPCSAADADGPVCTDFDGDGVFGHADACADGADCDDGNALTFPGAIEVPGDGLDNDCAGDGDASLDDESFVFVTANGTGNGTRTRPASLVDGLAAAATRQVACVVAAGTYDVGNSVETSTVIFGGYGPVDWTRGGVTTFVRGNFGASVVIASIDDVATGIFDVTFSSHRYSAVVDDGAKASVFGRVDFDSDCAAPATCGLLISSSGTPLIVGVTARAALASVGFDVNGGRFVDVNISGTTGGIRNNGETPVSVTGGRIVGTANAIDSFGTLSVTNAHLAVTGLTGAVIDIDDGVIVHSSLTALAPGQNFVTGILTLGDVVVVNSVVAAPFGGVFPGGRLVAAGNAITGSCAFDSNSACVDVATMNSCPSTPIDCQTAFANIAIGTNVIDQNGDLDPALIGVELRDFNVPTAVAGQGNAACRDLAAPAIGP